MKLIERIVIEGEKYPRKYEDIFEDKRGKRSSIIVNIPHPPSIEALNDFLDVALKLYDKYYPEYKKEQESNGSIKD